MYRIWYTCTRFGIVPDLVICPDCLLELRSTGEWEYCKFSHICSSSLNSELCIMWHLYKDNYFRWIALRTCHLYCALAQERCSVIICHLYLIHFWQKSVICTEDGFINVRHPPRCVTMPIWDLQNHKGIWKDCLPNQITPAIPCIKITTCIDFVSFLVKFCKKFTPPP